MIKGDGDKRAACSVLLHVFFFFFPLPRLAFAFSLIFLAYFVFMRFAIKFHHALRVIFYSREERRRARRMEPGTGFFFFLWMRIFKIHIKRYSRGYKWDTTTSVHDLPRMILISVRTHFCLLSPNELACLQHNPCSFSLSNFPHQLENL